jgi:molecular chaperone GrpE (heat shock protein)
VYNGLYFALGASVSCVYIIAIAIILVVFLGQRKNKTPKKRSGQASLPFVRLRDSVSQISGLLTEAGTNLEKLHLDIEDYGAKSWNQEKELEGKYYRLADSLFLLIDHLENAIKDGKKSDEIGWIYRRICRILEDEGIEEIPVKRGDQFNSTYHKHVDSRPEELPKSTVLEVTRKGYYMKDETGEDIILRPAEVVVSGGPSVKQP